jgi:diguanylate cyclase (GGDEF)-like protein
MFAMPDSYPSDPIRTPDLLVAYRMRTVGIAVRVTFMAVALLIVVPFVPGHGRINGEPYSALLVVALLGAGAAAFVVPWRWLFDRGWGERAMYLWSALDIILITLVAAATGGPTSEMVFLYALTTLFFAASYPVRGQVALFGFTVACYAILAAVWDPQPQAAPVIIRIATVGMVWFMAAFLASERTDEMARHLASRRLAEHRADLLRAVARTSAAITSLDADQVMAGVPRSLVDLGFDGAGFAVLDDGGRRYHIAHAVGMPEDFVTQAHPADIGLVALVRQRAGTAVIEHYGSATFAIPSIRNAGFESAVGAPVWDGGTLALVLVGTRREPTMPSSDVEVVEILAAQIGRALENVRRFEAEHQLAQTANAASYRDELTGVGNRRRVNLLLEGLRAGDALVLIDFDHFKDVNDERGHAAGDAVLVEFGDYLRTRVRDADDVARYGGEEFLVVLRAAGAGALAAAERLLRGWRALDPVTTFSGGVAVHGAGHAAAATLGGADAARYAAKQTGRDRICEYGSGLEEPVI